MINIVTMVAAAMSLVALMTPVEASESPVDMGANTQICAIIPFGTNEPSDVYRDTDSLTETAYFAGEYNLVKRKLNDPHRAQHSTIHLYTPATSETGDLDLFDVICYSLE